MSDVRPGAGRAGSGSYTRSEISVDSWRVAWHRLSTNLWQGRFTEAWHQLPQQEQQRLLSQVMDALNTAGGKELVMCSAAWSNERWPFFGVEEFPDLEAVQRHEQILTDLNWARYIESRTTLGTELILPQ
jgi:hypothetical protein